MNRLISTYPSIEVLFNHVLPGTPAAQAGLMQGDVVTAVDGQEIAGMRELQDAVQRAGFGGRLVLTYYRGAARNQTEVQL